MSSKQMLFIYFFTHKDYLLPPMKEIVKDPVDKKLVEGRIMP